MKAREFHARKVGDSFTLRSRIKEPLTVTELEDLAARASDCWSRPNGKPKPKA